MHGPRAESQLGSREHTREEPKLSCKDCDEFQASDTTSYFRWGTANIEVRACKKHLKEVYAALREAQSSELWRKQALKSQEKEG